ncbi:hypothetical protein ABT095_01575 [Kitasatospora sp. NPDC002227]|uniref:hypothetical protein n=1 Tax=Kitasatospora sp. NPDC002227 TaxID=3154773 RepID=UPI003317FC71
MKTLALALAATALLLTAGPATAEPLVNKGYSIPVGAITDLGALPVLGYLGYDLARL